jgi:glutamate dehydrogenase
MLAYGKIWLYQHMLDSGLPDDDFLQGDLLHYFPESLRKPFAGDIANHQLRREIIATALTNSFINRAGSHFVLAAMERTGASPEDITRAYLLAREAFDLRASWKAIEALDNKVSAKTQTNMMLAINESLGRAVQWFLNNVKQPSKLAPVIATYREGIEHLAGWLASQPPEINGRRKKIQGELVAQGVPTPLAHRIAFMPLLETAPDLTQLAAQSGVEMDKIAGIFFGLGQRLGLDWFADRAHSFIADTPWQREAVAAILDDLAASQRRLAALIVGKAGKGKKAGKAGTLADWLTHNAARMERYDAMLADWRAVGAVDVAMLTLASRQLAALLT